MNDSSNEEMILETRKRIFQEELEVLWERRLIPKSEYIRISKAYERHFQLALYKQKCLEHEKGNPFKDLRRLSVKVPRRRFKIARLKKLHWNYWNLVD